MSRLHTIRLTDSELSLLIEDMSGALGVGAEEEEPAWRTIYEKAIAAKQRADAKNTTKEPHDHHPHPRRG